MRIKLIDVDLKYREKKRRGIPFPNVALLKLYAHYLMNGHEVGFDIENPDLTYISCIFTRNRLYAIWEYFHAIGERFIGGSGVWLEEKLPDDIEFVKPNYDLYPHWLADKKKGCTSIGFTTRGCIRDCEFCIVREKEGKFHRHQHVREFHDDRFKRVTLLDNNILADKEWFFENTNWCLDHKLEINISQGMDIRLLTDEIAEQLHHIKFIDGQMRFAWDHLDMEDRVRAGIEMLRGHGINVRRNVSFFVLSGFNTHFCEDVYRCNRLHTWGARPYVMPFESGETPMIRALARWANRPSLRDTPFWKYERMPKMEVAI